LYPTIIEVSDRLSELGNLPGLMDKETHQLFASVAREIQAVTAQKGSSLDDVLNRWKDPVLAACKKLLENTS
jgi:hypothetical protein